VSVALMSAAFKTSLPSTRKLVLLALCDAANDQGECYPSVNNLVDKCSLGERTIQEAIAELEACNYLRREFRNGRSTVYWLTPAAGAPRSIRTPAAAAPTPARAAPPPPQQPHPTPAAAAPRTITEPSVEPSQKQIAATVQAPKPPPSPFLGDANLDSLNGRFVVSLAVAWELPEQWGLDAEALGWKPGEIVKESEKFRQYWTAGKGKGSRRSVKGWRQSWSNWLANAERYKR
jgi:hypothetical protein